MAIIIEGRKPTVQFKPARVEISAEKTKNGLKNIYRKAVQSLKNAVNKIPEPKA